MLDVGCWMLDVRRRSHYTDLHELQWMLVFFSCTPRNPKWGGSVSVPP